MRDDNTWRNKEQGINNSYYLNPMVFLNKHQKSVFFNRNYVQIRVRPLLEVRTIVIIKTDYTRNLAV
jgi:hypothetical protein